MTEQKVIEYLGTILEVPVVGEVPESPAPEFVVVDKTGSSTSNMITRDTVAIQSYAKTKYAASALNEKVIEAMETWPGYEGVDLITDYQFNAPSTKRYRYQALFEITYNRRYTHE